MGDSRNWSIFPLGPTNLTAYRDPEFATDKNQFMAFNCGASPCQAGQSVYQDVDVTNFRGVSFRFGGKFRTESGTGALQFVLWQLDASGAPLTNTAISVNATNTYSSGQSALLSIMGTAKYLRYQIYINSTPTFWTDEMFINVQ
jgi:hypothetical protein